MSAGGSTVRELAPEELAHKMGYYYGANVREGGFYNTLINPFVGISFKGMLFFQGESTSGFPAARYGSVLKKRTP